MMPDTRPPACRRASGWLVDRAYGELEGRSAALLEQHLASCPACAAGAHDVLAVALVRSVPAASELLPELVRRAAEVERLSIAGRRVGGFVARTLIALGLAIASMQVVGSRPALSHLPGTVIALITLSWTVLYTWLLEELAPVTPQPRAVLLSGRAVAYGVLGAVTLSLGMLGGLIGSDSAFNLGVLRRSAAMLPDLAVMLSSGALLLVGLCMGAMLGQASSPHMLLVLVLHAGIVFPALVRGAPALLRPDDMLFGIGLASLWGLSGAYLGSQLSRNHVTTPQTV